ncbi:MAG: transcription repressor NadR [Oscillospiraceae bacterium]|nr:transcription repressor NadR [Oscillospiraceae bacterium]
MNVTERREKIMQVLGQTAEPVPAKELAARFGVSRQVIVQDMAVIRASVPGIMSTYRGYILQQERKHSREFKVFHKEEDAARELELIVDLGGHVKNVSINHRIYGRITVEMDICSRQDVREFVEDLSDAKFTLLSSATGGYHYHLVEAAGEERLDQIEQALRQAGFLAPHRIQGQDREGEASYENS